MHHDILALLDAHLAHLRAARDQLAATRRVTPGERRAAVLHTVEVSERYAAHARFLLAELDAEEPRVPA
ncbi:hypothetical protein ACFO1B_46235 [Dactylosporangium siamense]|uniref:Uncharacterized protein n=1 Tax=Dactylosporangium siamense TaxID=685454 RepID=A0A919PY97_9ACTN|nr:hypothetical protein [Dactylosporangium siamense]GIG51471.1 hypothetical protein Dsi01nite_095120 [Dactylosporangium siamense]